MKKKVFREKYNKKPVEVVKEVVKEEKPKKKLFKKGDK